MPPLPDNLIANTMNNRNRRHERGHIDNDTIPRLHVSSIIQSTPADFFCPREFVLRYMERRETGGGAIPPKFELLFAVGHYYGYYLVQTFLERNPEYAQYAWGDWGCVCKKTTIKRKTYGEISGTTCKHCKMPVSEYVETDLFDPKKWIVGHADLIMLMDGVYYIYEFKSIDRADITFSTITEPLGDHLLQASHYYYMLKAEGKRVHPIVRFVYIDRSMTGLYTEKPFKEVYARAIPADRLQRIYARAKVCHSSIKKGTLPERKCKEITCSRAKTCTVPVSCFNRTKDTVKRIPLISLALTPLSPASGSIVRPSPKASGMPSRSGQPPTLARIRPAPSTLRKKSSRTPKD